MRVALSLTEWGEMRGGPESSQQTVPELSRLGEHDMHNNALVPSARMYAS